MKRLLRPMIILLLLVVAVIPLVSACAKPAPAPPKTLRIGVLETLTGPGSEALTLSVDGEKTAADWINDQGGIVINGQKYTIELVFQDIGASPDTAIAGANKLIYDEKTKFVLGPVFPFLSMAVASITEEAKVLRLKAASPGTPEEINVNTPYTFSSVAKVANIIPMFRYLLETYPQVKKVALICPDEPGAIFLRERAKKEAERLGLTVVLEDAYPIGTTDFYPLWTKIMAAEPDAVNIGPAVSTWAAGILKQGRELGFWGPMFSTGAGDVESVVEVAGKDMATDYFSFDPYVASDEMPSIVKEVRQRTQEKYGRRAYADDLWGWILPWYMTQAIEKAQSLDPTEVAKAWEKITSIKALGGTGKMGGLDFYGINHCVIAPEPISRIMNGEAKHIKWITQEFP